MNLIGLLVLMVIAAAALQLTRFWPRIAFAAVLIWTSLLVYSAAYASTNSLDLVSVTLALEPPTRDFLTLGLAASGALALATVFQKDRTSLGFLFWSWPAWLIALEVNNFVVAVFAWVLGLILPVLAMRPRQLQRAGGAASYLVVIVLSAACLLIANRFIELYPLTPERTFLIELAVLFLTLGLGLALGLVPFHLWVGPMADETPLSMLTMVLALGQPIGLWLLYRLFTQNVWLVEKSNLLDLMSLAAAASVVIGACMTVVERRAGRIVAYAAIFTLGIALLNLSRGTREGLAYASVEVAYRALGLAGFAISVVIGHSTRNPTARRVGVAGCILAGLYLVGMRLGVSFFEQSDLMLELAGADLRLFILILLAQLALLVGISRFAQNWLRVVNESKMTQVAVARADTASLSHTARANMTQAVYAQDNGSEQEGVKARTVDTRQVERQVAVGPQVVVYTEAATRSGEKEGRSLKDREMESQRHSPPSTRGGELTSDSVSPPGELAPMLVGGTPRRSNNGEGEPGAPAGSDDDYVFEEHMREIARSVSAFLRFRFQQLAVLLRPYVLRFLHILPIGVRRFFFILRRSMSVTLTAWRVWVGIAMIIGMSLSLAWLGATPNEWFQRVLAAFGQPPYIK